LIVIGPGRPPGPDESIRPIRPDPPPMNRELKSTREGFFMRKGFVLFLVSALAAGFGPPAEGQVRVSNVRFTDLGSTVSIMYDLSGAHGKKYNVSVALSDDGGRTFRIRPRRVGGDVGKGVEPGKNREILWRVREDFPSGLSGSNFVFAVDAELKKGSKAWAYLLGAAVIGGGVYFAVQGEEPSDKGSIVVEVPGEFP
jgi:hypothetical protein